MGKRTSSRSSTAADVVGLIAAVDHLADHVQCLKQAIDELADELQWRSRQTRGDDFHAGPVVLTSMPVDPTAEDWRIN